MMPGAKQANPELVPYRGTRTRRETGRRPLPGAHLSHWCIEEVKVSFLCLSGPGRHHRLWDNEKLHVLGMPLYTCGPFSDADH